MLEGVSYEEDESMHTMWAALLVNAAQPSTAAQVRPGFIALLKQMSPDEAHLLNWYYTEVKIRNESFPRVSAEFKFDELSSAYRSLENVSLGDDFVICLSNLEAADLIRRLDHMVNDGILPRYVSTARGTALYRACLPPEAK